MKKKIIRIISLLHNCEKFGKLGKDDLPWKDDLLFLSCNPECCWSLQPEPVAGSSSTWPPESSGPFLQCLFSADPLQPVGLCLPRGCTQHLPLLVLMRLLLVPLSSSSRSLWWAAQPSSALATAPSSAPPENLLSLFSGHLSRSLMEMWNPIGPRTISCGAYSAAGFQMNFIPLMLPFESSRSVSPNPLQKSFQHGRIPGCFSVLSLYTFTTPHYMVSRIKISRSTSFAELDVLLPACHEFKMCQLWKKKASVLLKWKLVEVFLVTKVFATLFRFETV